MMMSQRQEQATFQLGEQTRKQVQNFKYFGTTLTQNGLVDVELIKELSQNVGFLPRLLKDQNVPRKAKKDIVI
jgi:hypothetical protein